MYAIKIWICSITVILFATMGIGAMTRLTGSGLSIVEWKPISGVLPPLDNADWDREFKNYQQYPDYKSRSSLTLAEFKILFWWEFIHRLVARSILVVILIPYAFFVLRKQITVRQHRKVAGLILLGMVQGFLGWFMVKSGLVQVPRVSHFRLMIHFVWACLILGYLAQWLRDEAQSVVVRAEKVSVFLKILSWVCLAQLALGALVAGSRAGYIYNTFPKFGDTWLPQNFLIYPTLVENIFYNQINLQFFHRLGGWLLLLSAFYAFAKNLYWVAGLIFMQFLLGVFTLVFAVPPLVATFHQLVGAFLFFHLRYLVPNSLQRSGL
ncbi:MAG: COX15/CtaA family protein [Bdellovibrionaceae bacterium]|nr:COX15/CtaA family protein [Pseudobdellovibrionaceae bacterium]